MNPFTYSRAADIATAVRDVNDAEGTKFIAGGTNLIDLMKENVEKPRRLIDINHVDLRDIQPTESGGLRLGALVTNTDVAYHSEIEKRYPLLSKAILAGASAQIRNMATVGGNLLQRTRCCYFYDVATPCNKREPGSGCSAIHGFNRMHAILGASDECIAVHPSDMCVALAALAATVRITGQQGEREIPFADFHRLPEDHPEVDTTLGAGEIITAVDLPAEGFPQHYEYLKIRDRASYAFALVSVAAALEIKDQQITSARLALGGVAHKPWRSEQAETHLRGKAATPDSFRQAADIALQRARGFGHNDFKIELAKRAIVRAFRQAATGG